jgi:lipoprotein-anchoring transpeptidase ErfK/SrfK
MWTEKATPAPLTVPAPAAATAPAPVPAPAAPEPALEAPAHDDAGALERGATIGPKASGPAVLRAQVLLERAHFSSGEIDGAYGSNLRQAIVGYQKAHHLAPSGVVDAATWAVLEADKAPVLTSYSLTAADLAGPYRPVPADMAEKAKLPTLGYASLLEALGERFHASPSLLKTINPGKDFGRAGEQITVPNLPAVTLRKAARLMVDRSEGTLTLFDATGKTIAQFPASTGSEHDPLPVGLWKVNGVAPRPEYRYNPKLFWDAKPGDAKARIAPGPNNPVGLVWIALSKEHYGVHGTPEPALIGKTQSHGCIRLTNWDAVAVSRAVGPGVAVVLQE